MAFGRGFTGAARAGFALSLLATMTLTSTATAQLDSDERRCLTSFSKGVRKVSRTHGKTIDRCLKDFSRGKLVDELPEECIQGDPKARLSRRVDKETRTVIKKCVNGFPEFGTTFPAIAFGNAVVSQMDLVHRALGDNLDTSLISTSQDDATCQAKTHAALLKCADIRVKEYIKCQSVGTKSGAIVDGATMAAECLGTGLDVQPDPRNKIALGCLTKVANTVFRFCGDTDLETAFAPCAESHPLDLAECLSAQAACEMCLGLNELGIVRDCDAFDDGDDTNGSCGPECADGLIHSEETCDDGNGTPGDGCSDHCLVEANWSCTGEPSVCTPNCGNGALDEDEACDDGDTQDGDGCDASCQVEEGWSCAGEPSSCTLDCSNGTLDPGELCDDGNTASGDGCSSSCTPEPGYLCAGEPSGCNFVCGNGSFDAGETCDDGNTNDDDGCTGLCQIESGWLCSGSPSICSPDCGDGQIVGIENCDDGNVSGGDGCSPVCQVDNGYDCAGEPSRCSAICGAGLVRGFETCDDGNTGGGDGCSATFCRQEFDHACAGQPSVCIPLCGDGNLDGIEECDDGNIGNGDGCAGNCTVEYGFACYGTPSQCVPLCGNGTLDAGEECDDGNTNDGDGCGIGCLNEQGWLCPAPGAACNRFDVWIDTPTHGEFHDTGVVNITGHWSLLTGAQSTILINGDPPNVVDPVARTFSHSMLLDHDAVFNPILASLTNNANGDEVRDRIVVIAGASVPDGSVSPASVTLRMNESALTSMEPLVGGLAAGQFDIAAMVPPGTVVADDCFLNVIGCWGGARVTIANPPPSFSSFGLGIDSKPNAVNADIVINNFRVDVNIDGWGLVPDCRLRMTADSMVLGGDYALSPAAANPTLLDVNLVPGSSALTFNGFASRFTSGLCAAPIIGDIIQALMPDVRGLAEDGFNSFVGDPDGSGPEDSPIAQGIEDVMAGISISGSVGEGVGLQLHAPMVSVNEDNDGVTVAADAAFTVQVGNGPGQCQPPLGAPDFSATYSSPVPIPSFGPNTPGGSPYGLGICISTGGFNQLLRGQTECGLMRSSVTEIDLDGPGPVPSVVLSSTILSTLIPEFGQLPPGTPLRIDVSPTLAPVLTGDPGPGGEIVELKLGQMAMDIVEPGVEKVWMTGALDLTLGMDLSFASDGSGLDIAIGEPDASDVTLAVIDNPLGVDVAQVETVLPGLITPLIPELAGALAGFPLPQFFGLSIDGVEVSRAGEFLSLFANLNVGQ